MMMMMMMMMMMSSFNILVEREIQKESMVHGGMNAFSSILNQKKEENKTNTRKQQQKTRTKKERKTQQKRQETIMKE